MSSAVNFQEIGLAPDVHVIRQTLLRRYKPGQLIELRVPGVTKRNKKIVLGGVYDDRDKLTEDIARISSTTDAPAIYTGLQEIMDDTDHHSVVTNDFREGRRGASGNEISRYCWLLIDVDAVRAEGFAKSPTSDAEKEAAGEVLNAVLEYFIDLGIQGDVVDSGNSYHFIPAIDLPATPENEELLKLVLKSLAAKFDSSGAHVDTGMYDRPRICKLPGTLSRKGVSTPERPHRLSKVLSKAVDPTPISLAELLKIANLTEIPKSVVQVVAPSAEIRASLNFMYGFLDKMKISYGREKDNGELIFVVHDSHCPFPHATGGHHEGECHTGVNKEGKLCFACKHNSCQEISWSMFRAEVEKQRGETYQRPSGLTLNGVSADESVSKIAAQPAQISSKEIESRQPTSDPVEALARLEKMRVTEETQALAIEARIDKSASTLRPIFPYWVMEGTSLFEGLVKPAIEHSSKHAEFIFMSGVQVALNYLDRKVYISGRTVNFNMFLGFISPPGKFFKSSSASLAHRYYRFAGLCDSFKPSGQNTNAKENIVIFQTGSTEGLGKAMYKMGGKNAILFNDELGKLVAKAGVENSTLSYDLLSFYESGEFGNTVKTEKDCFNFQAGTYCFGWTWCTTDRGFNKQWPRIAGLVSGMEDRMFFVVCPEEPRDTAGYQDPEMQMPAMASRNLIAAAVMKGVYSYDNISKINQALEGLSARSINLVQALSLYFAVDLGRPVIDDDCVSRAAALVQYRIAVTKYLEPIEASTPQGRRQKEIERELRQNGGMMKKRDLCRNIDYTAEGSDFWTRSYNGLLQQKRIAEWEKKMPSGQVTRMVGLLRHEEDYE